MFSIRMRFPCRFSAKTIAFTFSATILVSAAMALPVSSALTERATSLEGTLTVSCRRCHAVQGMMDVAPYGPV